MVADTLIGSPPRAQVMLLFLFFHKRLCGPVANSCFHHQPDPDHRPDTKLEAAYHKADKAIQRASGSWGFTHSLFDPFFFRFRSTPRQIFSLRRRDPDCCPSSLRPLPHKFVTPKKTTYSLFGVSLIVWRRAGPS